MLTLIFKVICQYHSANAVTLNKKHTSNKIKRHTNKHPGKTIYFPCSKKQSPDQTKSRAHQIMFRRERNSNIGEGLATYPHSQ